MHLLSLLSGSDLASADGPDGLISDDDVRPVLSLGLESGELAADDIDGLAGLALGKALTAAPDNADAAVGRELGLGGDNGVGLAEEGASLGVAEDGPVDAGVLELRDADLAGVGTARLVVGVLGGYLDVLAEGVADEEEVEGGRGNDDLWKGGEKNDLLAGGQPIRHG